MHRTGRGLSAPEKTGLFFCTKSSPRRPIWTARVYWAISLKSVHCSQERTEIYINGKMNIFLYRNNLSSDLYTMPNWQEGCLAFFCVSKSYRRLYSNLTWERKLAEIRYRLNFRDETLLEAEPRRAAIPQNAESFCEQRKARTRNSLGNIGNDTFGSLTKSDWLYSIFGKCSDVKLQLLHSFM